MGNISAKVGKVFVNIEILQPNLNAVLMFGDNDLEFFTTQK